VTIEVNETVIRHDESDSETRETLTTKVCPKVIENRDCAKVIGKSTVTEARDASKNNVDLYKVIDRSSNQEDIEYKSEFESDNECTVSENMKSIPVADTFFKKGGAMFQSVSTATSEMRRMLHLYH